MMMNEDKDFGFEDECQESVFKMRVECEGDNICSEKCCESAVYRASTTRCDTEWRNTKINEISRIIKIKNETCVENPSCGAICPFNAPYLKSSPCKLESCLPYFFSLSKRDINEECQGEIFHYCNNNPHKFDKNVCEEMNSVINSPFSGVNFNECNGEVERGIYSENCFSWFFFIGKIPNGCFKSYPEGIRNISCVSIENEKLTWVNMGLILILIFMKYVLK